MSQCAIISIRPFFVKAIFGLEKRFEFRRVLAKFRTGDRMIVYASAPISMLVGEFRVGRVLTGTPSELKAVVGHDPLRQHTESYLSGAKSCTAIEIISPRRWSRPLPLASMAPSIKPPQSYVFVREEDGIFRGY
jgi:predicted transcriptional regulator